MGYSVAAVVYATSGLALAQQMGQEAAMVVMAQEAVVPVRRTMGSRRAIMQKAGTGGQGVRSSFFSLTGAKFGHDGHIRQAAG